jgi:hypothetical protein
LGLSMACHVVLIASAQKRLEVLYSSCIVLAD